jgi:hypothetical protein
MNLIRQSHLESQMPHTVARLATGVLLVAILPTSRQFAAEPSDPAKNYMGINVDFLNDYNGENAFVDMMKEGRNWENYHATAPATVDSENWPTQDCGVVVFGCDNRLGVYELFFEGQAASVSALYYQSDVTVSNLQYSAATNTSTADVTLNSTSVDGLHFQGTKRTAASAANTGIRYVRLYRPGYPTDGSVVFTNEWKAIVGKFHVIRFMNWLATNTNPIASWNQRVNPFKAPSASVTINGNTGDIGAAMEHFIQACNETNCDLWMNIPVLVDDDYVTETAQLIRYGSDGRTPYTSPQTNPLYPPLNPNLKVYVELGNELWNTGAGFSGFRWTKHITDSIIALPVGSHPITYDGGNDQYYSIARYTAWRTAEFGKLFRGVFGDAAMMTRVRPVLMGQLGGGWDNPNELQFIEGFYSTYRPSTDPHPNTSPLPVSYYVYGAGGSGYYGVYYWSAAPDVFFAGGNYPDSNFAADVTSDAVWAMNFGLKRIGYEGGMGLDGLGLGDTLRVALNADPRMRDVTVTYHGVWSSCAGDLLVYFEDRHNGNASWEFTNSVNDPNSPKLQAIDKLRDTLSRTPVSIGAFAPCTLDAQSAKSAIHSGTPPYDYTVNNEKVLAGLDTSRIKWIAFPVTARQTGWYRLSVRCGTDAAPSTIDIYLNGTKVATRTPASPMGNTAYNTVQLKSGLNVVRYQPSKGASYLQSIMLAPSDTAVGVVPEPHQAASLQPSALAVKAASGSVVTRMSRSPNGEDRFAVCNVEGRCIAKGMIERHSNNLILPRLTPGAYFLRLNGTDPFAGRKALNVAPIVIK